MLLREGEVAVTRQELNSTSALYSEAMRTSLLSVNGQVLPLLPRPLALRGFAMLSVIVSSLFIAFLIFAIGQALLFPKQQMVLLHETLVAEFYATELLEFFRAQSKNALRTYLTNKPYRFCAHINILDRQGAIHSILNPDNIALLPSPNYLDGSTPATESNRYYQIQTIDLATFELNGGSGKPRCGESFGTSSLLPNESYLVTVGVSWIPKRNSISSVKRVVMSTLIPIEN